MRFVTTAAAAALLLLPAAAGLAQTTTPPAATAAPAPMAPAPMAPAPTVPAQPGADTGMTAPAGGAPSKLARHRRQTLQQHFEAANTAKDGHLTLDQAKAAKWSYVTRHFSAIDKDKKGYVTTADIQAYAKQARAARRHPSTGAMGAPAGSSAGTAAPAVPPAAGAPAQTPE